MKNEKKALPYEIIMSAISGDAQSVNYVLEYYAPTQRNCANEKSNWQMEESMTKWMTS